MDGAWSPESARRVIAAYTPADKMSRRHLLADWRSALCGLETTQWTNQNEERLDQKMWLRGYCAACLIAACLPPPDAAPVFSSRVADLPLEVHWATHLCGDEARDAPDRRVDYAVVECGVGEERANWPKIGDWHRYACGRAWMAVPARWDGQQLVDDERAWDYEWCNKCRPLSEYRRIEQDLVRQLDERGEDERRGRVTCPKCGALGWWRFRTTSVNSVKFVCDGDGESPGAQKLCLDTDVYVHAKPDFDTAVERLKANFRRDGWSWPYE